jgi:predicted lipoprotein with Yx(FWY)xxD motif
MRNVRHRKSGAGDAFRPAVMTRILVSSALTLALSGIGFLAAGTVARGAARTTATVSLRQTKLGPILANAKGHTLYLFKKDRNGTSACSGSCASFWPPLLAQAKPTAGPGVNTLLLGTTRRSNGSLQVTYNKHPLYTYVPDTRAGQTNGEGILAFGAKWYAVSARGTAVVKPSTTHTTTTNPYPTTSTATTTTNPYP